MARTTRKQRFAMFAVSAAVVTGGALMPTSAFAAQAAPHTGEATALAAGHVEYTKSGHENRAEKGERGGKDKTKGKKNNKPRDVENMPGCNFYQGKVYCERKPDKPKPAPPTRTRKPRTARTRTAFRPRPRPPRRTRPLLLLRTRARSASNSKSDLRFRGPGRVRGPRSHTRAGVSGTPPSASPQRTG
ncbi:hypothetical protein WKI68_44700 [Streptomyces sp. MS1.HAVA.3]|uniref:Uncharacterized protein n=1 Tax=Streptomyces caledonius TaxID=3134107 RepID=A0ABU8UH51_9ACTN